MSAKTRERPRPSSVRAPVLTPAMLPAPCPAPPVATPPASVEVQARPDTAEEIFAPDTWGILFWLGCSVLLAGLLVLEVVTKLLHWLFS